ncbi:hypothetical protein GCM10023321_50630 [Pseudonocardia eucalypti]|uniref:Uncharacterized protein n=1 Tax=Pseudonocardia eucalypti TaxID=648755 RepID=A0ABP9QKP3_9PSEU
MPVQALDRVCTWQLLAPGSQPTVASEARGLPPSTAPSKAAEAVCAVPLQVVVWQSTLAAAREVEVGPAVGWPGSGLPSAPSLM